MVWFLLTAPLYAQQPPPEAFAPAREQARQLLGLRRVYVEGLGADPSAVQLRDMILAALQRAQLFLITEDESRADAFLRGSAQ